MKFVSKLVISLLLIVSVVFCESIIAAGFSNSSVRMNEDGKITLLISFIPSINFPSVKVYGGLERGQIILNREFRSWKRGSAYVIYFNWKPPADGIFRLYFEVNPDDNTKMREKHILDVRVTGRQVSIVPGEGSVVASGNNLPLPDLNIASVKIDPVEPNEGNLVRINVTITNGGTYKTIFPTKGIITHDSKKLCEKSFWNDLEINKAWNFSCRIISARTGVHLFKVMVDPNNIIAERDELNNTSEGTYYVNAASDMPDIVEEE